MTGRSVIIGLACAMLLCAVTYFNDMVMRGTYLVGNFLPVAVFGSLTLFLLLVNPLLQRLSPRACLNRRELATIVTLMLFACCVPGRGLMHYFTNNLMFPHHHLRTTPSWQSEPPTLAQKDLADPASVIAALGSAANGPPALQALRAALPGATLAAGSADEQRGGLLAALNTAITQSRFAMAPGATAGLRLTRHVRDLLARDPATLSAVDVARINRGAIDALFPDAVAPQRLGPIDRTPDVLLTNVDRDPASSVDAFVTGLAEGEGRVRWRQLPWRVWVRPLLFWVPLLLTVGVMVTALALVLHRQWSTHERLPYPTVEFARALLPEDGQAWSPTLRNRRFWIGMLAVLGIHMNNYACTWWPDILIPIRIHLDLGPLQDLIPVIKKGGPWMIFDPTLSFTAIGFAYFLATDVSLSLGLAPYLYCLAVGILASYGVPITGGLLRATSESGLYAGAYFAMFAVLLYTGRHYYASALRRGLGLRARDPIEATAVWGMRVFLASIALFVYQLVLLDVDWQLALLYVVGLLVMFTVMSRLVAEAGVPFLHTHFAPCVVLWGLMGARALGPDQLLVLTILSGLLSIDPRETMMPFAVSGVCLIDRVRVRIGPAALWGLLALVLGLAVALPATLKIQYQRGAVLAGDGWTTMYVPRYPYDINVGVVRQLQAQGLLESSRALSGWARFAHVEPMGIFVTCFGITFALVILFTWLRFRFIKWPLHPLLFLMMGTWSSRSLAFSFLIGCLVKSGVMKYGGARLYQRLKPLMIGLVAGEMLAAILPVIIGAVYYFVKGLPPLGFRVTPG
ncbi:MAG: hypothetical protein K8T26_06190 [Lentisphaerae bacterium]|nr:hypothetical protein [Lentisphaerota bacterium]